MINKYVCKLLTWTIFVWTSCGVTSAQTLVWEEKFKGNTINPQTWTYDMGDGCDQDLCNWGNSELKSYTNSPKNARIEKGHLVIETHKEALNGKNFTSARLKTEGRMQFKYGTVEARIKLPNVNQGVWPAFWTLGAVGNWPARGEIDMMEVGSKEALKDSAGNRRVSSAAHWSKADGSHDFNVFYTTSAADLSKDHHLYKMVWTRQFIKMYLDNVEYYSFDISGGAAANVSEFHNPHYLLLNLAVGGAYTGIEFTKQPINATIATHLHIDIWTPNSKIFKIKLVDFGDNAVFQGTTNDDSEDELSFTPTLGSWVSYDIPLSDFKGLKARAHLAQLILVGSNSQMYVDNVYFYNDLGKTSD